MEKIRKRLCNLKTKKKKKILSRNVPTPLRTSCCMAAGYLSFPSTLPPPAPPSLLCSNAAATLRGPHCFPLQLRYLCNCLCSRAPFSAKATAAVAKASHATARRASLAASRTVPWAINQRLSKSFGLPLLLEKRQSSPEPVKCSYKHPPPRKSERFGTNP